MLTLPNPQSVSQSRARIQEGGREVEEEEEGGFDGSRPAVDWSAVQWPAAASMLYCAQILNWQTKHSILYNCSIMMQHYYYRISTFAGYSLSNIANTTLWNLMISLRIDHFEPIPCHCLSGSAQRPWKEDLCAPPLCTTHHFHVIVLLSHW